MDSVQKSIIIRFKYRLRAFLKANIKNHYKTDNYPVQKNRLRDFLYTRIKISYKQFLKLFRSRYKTGYYTVQKPVTE